MNDDSPIMLSALVHYLYCPRRCALVHIEQIWSENRFTAEGRVLHEKTDAPRSEKRKGVRTVTAMPLEHETLGIAGVADVVEFHAGEGGEKEGETAYPVEYKRGRPKAHRADEVQLCAQALCLEAMLGRKVPEGALYYGKTRRRVAVVFDRALRALTEETILATRVLFAGGRTPRVDYDAKRCDPCSLIDLCQPRLLKRGQGVNLWLSKELAREEALPEEP